MGAGSSAAKLRASGAGATRRTPRRSRSWVRLCDEDLLQVRLCDLDLDLDNPRLARPLERLYTELESRGLRFRPHAWLAEEWFSPDGVPGIAIPFWLAHPRLRRLERNLMREVEGGNLRWLMRILRHEAGHALDNAFRLRRRARWRELFGPASLPYPDRYRARPGSRRYVHNLGEWYAQSHPTEDFAETFAVWLKPNSNWRTTYAGWPAFNKLCLVDELMAQLSGRTPPVRNRRQVEPVSADTRTLAEVYRARIERLRRDRRGMVEELLRRTFTTRPEDGSLRASTLLRALKPRLVESVSHAAGVERYSVYQILRMLIERCEALKLHVRGPRRDASRQARLLVLRLARTYRQGETPTLLL